MTLYLKYRPQKISDLDNKEVREALEQILKSGDIPHSWLFSGPRGIGKTSSARILAKSLNCLKGKYEPCNECEMCKSISDGSCVDVVEIDAASNRGIDEIRELREKVRLSPMNARNKVYIIDEVHMLTNEAANALLKTLEEPPENTVFVLCTTEAEKLPETVISRCARILFKKPSLEEIYLKLKKVALGEKQKISDEDLMRLAKAARGSFRDAIKVLEQVFLSGGEVDKVLGSTENSDPDEFLNLFEAGKTRELIKKISGMEKMGTNFRVFTEELIGELRVRILQKAEKHKPVNEIRWVEELAVVYNQMKTAAVTQLPLEIWVISNQKETSEEPKKVVIEEVSEIVSTGKGKYSLDDLSGKWGEVMKAVRPKNHSVEALLRSTKPMLFDGQRLELEVFYKFHKDKLETEKCKLIVEEAVSEVFGEKGIKLYLKLGQKNQKITEEVSAVNVTEDVIKAAEEIFGAQAI